MNKKINEILENIKFDQGGLIPAIAQDYKTNTVLMLAYMSRKSLEETIRTGKAVYYSRSRNALWVKGETSGHFQNIKDIYYDCDMDAILLIVEQIGAACHTEQKSCFYRSLLNDEVKATNNAGILYSVFNIIKDRQANPREGSYTNYLFNKGCDKILKKVGEECSEVIIATKNNDKNEIIYETADLIYHLSVNLANSGLSWDDIFNELSKR